MEVILPKFPDYRHRPVSLRYDVTGGSSSGTLASETRYLYDGRRVIQERSAADTPLVSYTRGWDLSGSFEGAGGIGGMLARSHGYSGGNWSTHHAYHADGGGNISAMVSTAQSISANYKYDPYGNLISSSGTMADSNLYRFSSKEYIETCDIYYYGYRFYDPVFQRWLNQDPHGEFPDGPNLHTFVGNSPVSFGDPNGLWKMQFSGGWGLAIEVTFGIDPNSGSSFFGFGIGYGKGANFSWDPFGSDPYRVTRARSSCSGTTMYNGIKATAAGKFLGFGADATAYAGFAANPNGQFEGRAGGGIGGPLGLGVEGQLGWNNETGPFKEWDTPWEVSRRGRKNPLTDFGFRAMALREYGFSWSCDE